jgi:hypothetical protein
MSASVGMDYIEHKCRPDAAGALANLVRGAYVVSVAERTGGQQRHGTPAAAFSNGAPEPALAASVSPLAGL